MTDTKEDFVKVNVAAIMLDPFSNVPIIILKDDDEKHTVPIWIGLVEASAIAVQLENVQVARPLTHDLLKNVINLLGAKVEKIEVTDLRDNTFFALIHLMIDGNIMEVDSRPSDAIALALRTQSPIYVHKKVIEKSQKMDAKKMPSFNEEDREKWADLLEDLDPEDFSKYKM